MLTVLFYLLCPCQSAQLTAPLLGNLPEVFGSLVAEQAPARYHFMKHCHNGIVLLRKLASVSLQHTVLDTRRTLAE
jgi:hypothetical protein